MDISSKPSLLHISYRLLRIPNLIHYTSHISMQTLPERLSPAHPKYQLTSAFSASKMQLNVLNKQVPCLNIAQRCPNQTCKSPYNQIALLSPLPIKLSYVKIGYRLPYFCLDIATSHPPVNAFDIHTSYCNEYTNTAAISFLSQSNLYSFYFKIFILSFATVLYLLPIIFIMLFYYNT